MQGALRSGGSSNLGIFRTDYPVHCVGDPQRQFIQSDFRIKPWFGFIAAMVAFLQALTFSRAATGDIVDLTSSNGWLYVSMEGLNTSGTYHFGISSAASFLTPTNPTVVLKYTSLGFTTIGSPTTFSRTNFATKPVRKTYPNANQQEETLEGNILTVRLALMDYTYQKDANFTASVSAGFYTANGISNNAVTDMPVVNTSTHAYPKPVANWSRPPLELMTQGNAVFGVTGFGHHAADGRPLQCVQVWAVDLLGNTTPTVSVPAAEIDSSYGDALPVIEYVAHLDLAGLTRGLATAHFRAFPRLGDTETILDTSDGRFTFPTHEAGPTRFFADPQNNYGRTIAVVALNGINTSAKAIPITEFDPNNPPNAFSTLAAAITAIGRTNWLLYGRSDPGGATIYMRAGSHAWTGGTIILTNQPSTWVTVESFPGETAIFNSASGSRNASILTKIKGVRFSSNSSATLDDMEHLLIARDTIITNTTDTRFIDSVTNVWVSGATIDSLPQGFRTAGISYNSQFRMLRGCRINMAGQIIFPTIILGNLRYAGIQGAVKIQAGGLEAALSLESPSYPIIAFNAFFGQNSPSGGHLLELWTPNSRFINANGFAVVQNIVEQISSSASASRSMSIASSSSSTIDNNPAPFAILWHNTVLGQRANLLENAGGDIPDEWIDADRRLASHHNNLFEQPNTKDDRHYVACNNGKRAGSIGFQHGINSAGNVDLDPNGMDSGNWSWNFFGISSFPNTNSPSPAILTWPQFVRRSAGTSDGGATAAGFGDYHLQLTSPAANLAYQFVLPFDLDGKRRKPRGASGAFEVRKNTVVTIEASDPDASEPVRGLGSGVVTISRAENLDVELTVNLAVSGSATEGLDYTSLATTVSFDPGAATATLVVTPIDDTELEVPESIVVTLVEGSGYALGTPNSATVTLQDDDAQVSIAATDANAGEPASGLGTGTFTLTRVGALDNALTVNLAVSGSATEGLDYTTLGTTVSFDPGAATAILVVTPIDDSELEVSESIVVTLVEGSDYALGTPNSATVTLHDDDTVVTVAANDSTAGEPGSGQGTGQFRFTRTGIVAQALTIQVTISGTATPGSDFAPLSSSVAFAAGSATSTQTVTVVDDSIAEGNETVVVTVVGGPGYRPGTPASATVTIRDDDADVTVTATDATAGEPKTGQGNGRFTFTRVGSTSGSLTVNFSVSGSAANGEDYTSIGTTVTFSAGSATATKTINVLDDLLVEGDESVVVTVEPGTNYGVANPSTAQVLIKDNDSVMSITATDATAGEPGSGMGTGRFTLSRLGSTAASIKVFFVVSGTATPGTDYTSIGTSATFAAGSSTVTKTVTVINDSLAESIENVIVTLTSGAGYTIGTPSAATVTITDDDPSAMTGGVVGLASAGGLDQRPSRLGDLKLTVGLDHKFRLTAVSRIGRPVEIQSSDDLIRWIRLGETGESGASSIDLDELILGSPSWRFFRLQPLDPNRDNPIHSPFWAQNDHRLESTAE